MVTPGSRRGPCSRRPAVPIGRVTRGEQQLPLTAGTVGAVVLDLRGIGCPLTFVRTRITLDRLPIGEQLEVLLDEGEPSESVPRSCREDGDVILALGPWVEPGVIRMVVARPG